ncbi:MAG: CpaF family protein [Lachnospiraceae bacterium]|nr:CpaF family protein [Lachnospiraceae bacterium]
MKDEEVKGVIEKAAYHMLKNEHISLECIFALKKDVFNSMRRLDVLQDYLEDENITEIMVNGCDSIFVEKRGELIKSNKSFDSEERLMDIIQNIVGDINRTVNERKPIADARLKDGSRVNIVLPPISINGPIVTIRKFKKENYTLSDLVEMGSLSQKAKEFLEKIVKARYNIFICGGTDTGKTTFLNALAYYIHKEERVVTIEDLAELKLDTVENLVSLEARDTSIEEAQVSIRDLIKTALRMRPDRIIVGEVRDSAVIDLMNAYNTGHDGSISTGHGNSTKDMITRLITMFLMGMELPEQAIKKQIASAIDIFVHLGRNKNNKRVVFSIDEVCKDVKTDIRMNNLFYYDFQREELIRSDRQLNNTQKMERRGIEYSGL